LAERLADEALPRQRERGHPLVFLVDFDERLFREYYSVPFRMGFEQGGSRAVMTSYNA